MTPRARHAALGAALVATLVAAVMAPEPADVVGISGPVGAPGASPTAGRTPEEILGIRPRGQSNDSKLAFSPRQWAPPPARPRAAVAKRTAAKPPAKAPPLPFRALGQYVEGDQPVVFLQIKDKTLIVKQGDVIETDYRVERIADGNITFTYMPLAETQTLALGEQP